ncbi:fructose-bisphosphate aldolase, class I/fructose-bisphosphate aldolase / 2-amino-3,7-dideoxy-D-threo-hept-6-ulosonate synthase/2-amino-4,5-dihydroxy-6-oxo-7-(phosphonooxy)heptanoate synthase [Amycolatopsis xylanica]|uniref:Fructose-bisphosphate aldolase, class I/fructose-bisphosphate aldolase / 2-amino-3,7-dideoxy-D-threo-hept-6-ulosonate synthase/2-amino-4,5-dihydroxy-6-oxo-7-(Phosphonooxy)heptanoate synthase n=1 Tax=Amycolatopsis xylanica TaxID=589385 RepID=A0A1H3T8M7_9PSEU|nr:fructose-bisphosphate aldolase [Amycolatopsis xylanica]SDZ46622.1 fructose-bisphosphate aldolase, class I/fructose-bisphosphate aldolase / 2-amino-3,7-dideoxy-D-threo-hept-6-ulosonate synthase/2-amino-4,5-dihydroxy-6-oxo-7-(phosphonooxy)heptanoate synthase [Amycolatopsis xylanica]
MISGKARRLRRLLGADGKTFLVALDHSVTTGAVGGLSDMGSVMRAVVLGGADGIVTHRGSAATSMPAQRETALVVHLSANTALSPRPELKTRVCDPEVAAALGADAVSAHVTLGCGPEEDRAALADLGGIARSCDRLGLPLLVMTYARTDAADAGPGVLHAARVAAELGADIVKTAHPGDEHLAELVTSVPVPVVIAGGQLDGSWEDFLGSAKNAMGAGVAGLCVGRRVFGSADAVDATAQLRAIVHGAHGSDG